MRGIRASGFTPIAETLIDFKGIFNGMWTGSISTMDPKPRTFVIFLTDGDDTCTGPATSQNTTGATADNRALRAAYRAQLLYERIVAAEPASSVISFVVVFGTGASANRGNWVAWGGSGMNQAGVSCGVAGKPACIPITGAGGAAHWSAIPTAAQRAACTTCRDAFLPASVDDLISALQMAIDQGQAQGEFSDQQSITESIYELASGADRIRRPRHALQFHSARAAAVHLRDARLQGPPQRVRERGAETSLQLWDAGQLLTDRVATSLGTAQWSFTQLRGGAGSTHATIGAHGGRHDPPAHLHDDAERRTSSTGTATDVGNLTTARFVPPGQIALWPPDPTVDPPSTAGTYPAGVLDDELGIIGPGTEAEFDALQNEFGACTASVGAQKHFDCRGPMPAGVTADPAPVRPRACPAGPRAMGGETNHSRPCRGGDLVKNGTNAERNPTTRDIQFQSRAWLLAESTLAAPAVVTPPLQPPATNHAAEYTLYRDGPRNGSGIGVDGLANGFGLRNPDKDSTSAAPRAPTAARR